MAVSNTDTLIQYAGNNSAVTAYPITFPFDENSWIRCQLLDSTGTISDLVLDTDYTVTGAGGASGNLVTAVAYDNTHQLTIYRVVPLTQLLDLVYNDRLPAQLLEDALDKLTYIGQQLSTLGEPGQKTLKFPISEPTANEDTLPVPADRLAKVIYFNATTGALELVTATELALTLDPTLETLVEGKQNVPDIKAANFTAANNEFYIITASATVTDPTPVQGEGYTVFVRNGTATVNAVAYATAGTIIRRIYHSGAWTSYVYYTEAALATLTQTLTNKTLTTPTITNPTVTTGTFTNPTVNNYTEGVVSIGNSGTSKTIDLTAGTFQTVTLTGNCTFTMPTATAGKSFVIKVLTGAGGFTGTFTGVKWPGASTPTVTATASKFDLFSFVADGSAWSGTVIPNFTA